MCELLKKLNYKSDLTYRRCGDIVVAPERNIFALYCNLCEDFFMNFQEFVRHARQQHDDEYEFEIGAADNVYAYGLEELIDGMTMEDIDAAEKEEWERRKKFGLYEEELEETNFNGHLVVSGVHKQDANVIAEQKSVSLTKSVADHPKRTINEVEFEMLLKRRLSSHDGDDTFEDMNAMQMLATEKTLQLTDEFIVQNIENTKGHLISEENMVLECSGEIKTSTEPSLIEDSINSLILDSNDLANVSKSTTLNSLISEENPNSLMLDNVDQDYLLVNVEKTKSSPLKNSDKTDSQKITNIPLTTQEETNSLVFEENIKLPDLQEMKNIPLITQEETNSLVHKTSDLYLPRYRKEYMNSDANIDSLVLENPVLEVLKNINEFSLLKNIELADLQNNTKEFTNKEERSLSLGNPDMVDLENAIKEPAILEENSNSLKLENPDLADLLTEFNTDLNSFDMDICEKLTPPEKILENNIVGDGDMSGEVGVKFIITGNKSNESRKKGRPKKKKGMQRYIAKSTKAVQVPTSKIKETNLRSRSSTEKSTPSPDKKYFNANNLSNATNVNSKKPLKSPDENNKNISTKNASNVKTPLNSNNFNETIKKLNKSPVENSKTHANKNLSTIKTPIKLSPDDTQFHKSLKVRIEKLSPSPKKDETNNLKMFNSNSKMSSESDKVIFSKAVTNASECLQNLPNVARKPTTPLKNIDSKQNLTEHFLKNIDNEYSSAGNTGKTQLHPFSNNKKILRSLRTRKASIDVLPEVENINETPLTKNKNSIRNKSISRTTHKNLVLERMTQIRKRITQMLDDGEVKTETKLNDTKIKKPQKIKIQNVTILNPQNSTKSGVPSPYFSDFKKPIVADESHTTQVTTRKSLFNQSRQSKTISPKKLPEQLVVSNSEVTKFELPDSIIALLQDDSSQNNLDVLQLDRILQQDISKTDENLAKLSKNEANSKSILEELPAQIDVSKMQIVNEQKLLNKNDLNFKKLSQEKILPPMNKEIEMKSKTKANLNDIQLVNGKNLNKKQNITILQTNTPTEGEPSFDVLKNPITKVKDESQFISNTSVVEITNRKSSFKTPIKTVNILPKITPKQSVAVDLEAKKLILSNSAKAFLQNESSQNKLDACQFNSSPQQDIFETDENLTKQSKDSKNESSCSSIVEELLHQVVIEENENKQSVQCKLEDKTMDAFERAVECEEELLDKLGLSFMKMSPAEILPITKEEEMHSKAKKFAAILENNPIIWDTKNYKHKIAEERKLCFNSIKQRVNCDLAVNLTLSNIKRVCNLIMSWYTNQFNSQFVDKKDAPKNLKIFIDLFLFLPKIGRLIYNCEFCDEQLRTEHAYMLHRCTHTGGTPYKCVYCGKGFSRPASFRAHENKHIENINGLKNIPGEQQRVIAYSPLAAFNVQTRQKLKREHSPETNEIENDTKKHKVDQKRIECNIGYEKADITEELHALNKMYKCKLCNKVLQSVEEVQKHIEMFHKQISIRRRSINEQ